MNVLYDLTDSDVDGMFLAIGDRRRLKSAIKVKNEINKTLLVLNDHEFSLYFIEAQKPRG